MITGKGGRLRSRERLTALLIPCPWSGDESDPIGWTYRAWYRLYRTSRVARHKLGLHDWRYPPAFSGGRHCTWCGNRQNIPAKVARGESQPILR